MEQRGEQSASSSRSRIAEETFICRNQSGKRWTQEFVADCACAYGNNGKPHRTALENCPAKIEAGGIPDIIMAIKREQVRKLHPYAITPPKTESGRWQTTYRDSNNKRISIKAQTENELLDKLVKIYFSNQHFDKLTFYGLYQEWLAYKKTVVNSQNTIKRHEQHYRKYFETSLLHERRIKYLDELTLESECNRIIRDFKMSRKEWGNVKGILNGMFDFAVRKHYLDTSPMNNVTISVKFRQVVKKTGKPET